MYENPGTYVLKLLIYLSSFLGQETAKRPFRSSSQAATCYYTILTTKGMGTISPNTTYYLKKQQANFLVYLYIIILI